jgi:hypothetical protein
MRLETIYSEDKDIVITMSVAELKSIVNVLGQSQYGESFEEYMQLADILDRFQEAAKNYTS